MGPLWARRWQESVACGPGVGVLLQACAPALLSPPRRGQVGSNRTGWSPVGHGALGRPSLSRACCAGGWANRAASASLALRLACRSTVQVAAARASAGNAAGALLWSTVSGGRVLPLPAPKKKRKGLESLGWADLWAFPLMSRCVSYAPRRVLKS